MLLSSSLQVTLIVALVLICINAYEDDNGTSKEQEENKSGNIQCTVSDKGVKFETELCNKTQKTILKISMEDEYTAVIPTLPPTEEPTSELSNSNGNTDELEEATPTPVLKMPPAFYKDLYDEWDYEYGETFSEVRKVLEEEKKRHESSEEHFPHIIPGGPHIFPERNPGHSWKSFCEEAAKEDEKPIRVSDGSFHPKFEVVPGLGVYRFHATPKSWDDARSVCENEGAQLAIANSQEEADFLKSFHNRCPDILDTHFNDYQYLGVHDLYGEGKWETYAGDPLEETGFVRWAFGQPDNAHHYGEDCLTLNRYGLFNDVPCWTKLPFTCEHP